MNDLPPNTSCSILFVLTVCAFMGLLACTVPLCPLEQGEQVALNACFIHRLWYSVSMTLINCAAELDSNQNLALSAMMQPANQAGWL